MWCRSCANSSPFTILLFPAFTEGAQIPIVVVDSYFYGKMTAVFWNIVKYNVFPDASRGPDLYGTEPWYYYLLNLSLNFNILLPMALFSLPALAITSRIDRHRLGNDIPSAMRSSPFRILALRLLPLYVWIGIFTVQPHKEERFMYPVFPLVCFNAAVMTYLLRGWLEVAYIKITKSPYRVGTVLQNHASLLTPVARHPVPNSSVGQH